MDPLAAPLPGYCDHHGRIYDESSASCVPDYYPQRRLPAMPFETAQAPGLPACLFEADRRCEGFGSALETRACREGARYSQRPRALVTEAALRSVATLPHAFSLGLQLGNRCPKGVDGSAMLSL